MNFSQKTKKILFFAIIVLPFVIVGYFLLYEYHYKIIWQSQSKKESEIERLKASYAKSPNSTDAYLLLEHYMAKNNYDKAIYYGKATLKYGADDKTSGGRINFFISRACFELGKYDTARSYLETAFKHIQSNHDIDVRYNTVKKYGMDVLLSPDEWGKLLSVHSEIGPKRFVANEEKKGGAH